MGVGASRLFDFTVFSVYGGINSLRISPRGPQRRRQGRGAAGAFSCIFVGRLSRRKAGQTTTIADLHPQDDPRARFLAEGTAREPNVGA